MSPKFERDFRPKVRQMQHDCMHAFGQNRMPIAYRKCMLFSLHSAPNPKQKSKLDRRIEKQEAQLSLGQPNVLFVSDLQGHSRWWYSRHV